MDLDLIKHIIVTNRNSVCNIKLVKRNFDFDNSLNYVLVGVRQAGKSFLLYQIIQEIVSQGVDIKSIVLINFDDERLAEITAQDLNSIIEAHYQMTDVKPIFFLDEIQNVKYWEKFARRLANEKYHVFVTGSNAKMLSNEVATTLGGRYLQKFIYPYSFSEYLNAINFKFIDSWQYDNIFLSKLKREFQSYFYFGGFPELVNTNLKREWLSGLFQKIFLGDIISRYHIKNDDILKILLKKLAESTMQPTSYSRLANLITSTGRKIQTNTIIDYLKFSEDSWLIFSIQNFCAKLSERESSKKYYFRDNGIINLFLFNSDTILLENLVAIHLKRLYNDDLYFFRQNIEIDFYLPENGKLIQVSYKIQDDKTFNREIMALIKGAKFLNVNDLTIITYDDEQQIIQHDNYTIKILPYWKFCLIN
ncbi:MAG: ATP-binding protein [Bacteroidales bacterium]|nr:ATP-binding protein [Bacteroidales bacterium]